MASSADEHPVALQLGGSDPAQLADAAAIGEALGYDEINLNVGCPSRPRAGGPLRRLPDGGARARGACVAAMQRARRACPSRSSAASASTTRTASAISQHFIDAVAGAGCDTFIVHARKAWLKGLSPKENREVPPLDYARVYRLKAAHPELTIVLNGGIGYARRGQAHLEHVDGVMLGRAAYQTPYILAEVDRGFFDG